MHLQGNFENNLAAAFDFINTGKIDKAIDLFRSGKAGRIILKISKEE